MVLPTSDTAARDLLKSPNWRTFSCRHPFVFDENGMASKEFDAAELRRIPEAERARNPMALTRVAPNDLDDFLAESDARELRYVSMKGWGPAESIATVTDKTTGGTFIVAAPFTPFVQQEDPEFSYVPVRVGKPTFVRPLTAAFKELDDVPVGNNVVTRGTVWTANGQCHTGLLDTFMENDEACSGAFSLAMDMLYQQSPDGLRETYDKFIQ